LDSGEDAAKVRVGRDTIGQFQEGPQENLVVTCSVSDLHEVIPVSEHATKA
jgi:hypothetical protein